MNNQQKSAFSKLSLLFKKRKKLDTENDSHIIEKKEEEIIPLHENTPPHLSPKDKEVLPDKLVSNLLSGTPRGVWEYPSPSLLSEDQGRKAERGDINKIASTIEKTLQSFGVDSRVAEANLGP